MVGRPPANYCAGVCARRLDLGGLAKSPGSPSSLLFNTYTAFAATYQIEVSHIIIVLIIDKNLISFLLYH